MIDDALNYSKGQQVVGVDEAGRGPLAGPVYAAAVILNDQEKIIGLNDSKKLAATTRSRLAEIIKEQALAWQIASASVAEIDELNILQASLLAMKRAVEGLPASCFGEATSVLVDGNQVPSLTKAPVAMEVRSVVRGDSKFACIAAASILAKVARDEKMLELDRDYPAYGFARHKGYGTKIHLHALHEHGASPIHRRSFSPIRQMLEK